VQERFLSSVVRFFDSLITRHRLSRTNKTGEEYDFAKVLQSSPRIHDESEFSSKVFLFFERKISDLISSRCNDAPLTNRAKPRATYFRVEFPRVRKQLRSLMVQFFRRRRRRRGTVEISSLFGENGACSDDGCESWITLRMFVCAEFLYARWRKKPRISAPAKTRAIYPDLLIAIRISPSVRGESLVREKTGNPEKRNLPPPDTAK